MDLLTELSELSQLTPERALAARESVGTGYSRVARELGLHPATVWRYETGRLPMPGGELGLRYLALIRGLERLAEIRSTAGQGR